MFELVKKIHYSQAACSYVSLCPKAGARCQGAIKTPYLLITIGNQVKRQSMWPLHTLKALAPLIEALAPLIEALAPLIEALAPNYIDHY